MNNSNKNNLYDFDEALEKIGNDVFDLDSKNEEYAELLKNDPNEQEELEKFRSIEFWEK